MSSQEPSPWSAPLMDLVRALPARQSVEVNGLPISYRTMGEGRPILFLHGLLGSADSWLFQLHDLSSRYRVISWDAPGYGQSAEVEPDIEAFAEQLRGFIAKLALPSLTVVGHSMGGTLAARVAADPEPQIWRVILSCTHPGYGEPLDTPPTAKLVDRIRALKEEGGEAYGRERATNMVAHPVDPFALETAAYVASGTKADGLFSATRMLQFADLRSFYEKITIPMLVLFAQKDPVVRPELSAELRALTPQATQKTLPNVGHAPYLEDKENYEQVITSFIAHSSSHSEP
nr:alpha/beta hydrolase [uncultured Cohaesibacter sp.]